VSAAPIRPPQHVPASPPDIAAIYDAELSYVWSCLRRLGVARSDLEDVAHDVFVVIHRRLGTYDPARPLRPWLFGIAFRVVSEHRRHHVRRGAFSMEEEPADPSTGEDAITRHEERAWVHGALAAVPLERRAVLLLHDVEGCTAPEIAELVQVPLNTVYSRLRIARHELSVALAKLEGSER
jgi:RNA polymerase sigma-70 factor (ECF subfamily)